MDAHLPRLEQIASYYPQFPHRLLQLAVTAGWLAGSRTAEHARWSCWVAENKDASITAALAFLELNRPNSDNGEFFDLVSDVTGTP